MYLFSFVAFSCYVFFIQVLGQPEINSKYVFFEDNNGNVHYEDVTIKTKVKIVVSFTDIKLFLYTRNNSYFGCEILSSSFKELRNCPFYDSTKKHYFIIHGWKNSYNSEVNVVVKEAILQVADVNVFVVDWGAIAKNRYVHCVSVIKNVGEGVASFINDLIKSFKLSSNMFTLIGHSLGAHVAGCTGAAVKGSVKYIVGLDPAGPLFTMSNKENRLDRSNAEFVHVIHTSTMLLGFSKSIGHADYYPNNGKHQPGCAVTNINGCSHARAYIYYAESIIRGGFLSIRCDSYKSFKNGECNSEHRSFLGQLDLDTNAHYEYYLDTRKESPYSLD